MASPSRLLDTLFSLIGCGSCRRTNVRSDSRRYGCRKWVPQWEMSGPFSKHDNIRTYMTASDDCRGCHRLHLWLRCGLFPLGLPSFSCSGKGHGCSDSVGGSNGHRGVSNVGVADGCFRGERDSLRCLSSHALVPLP